MNPVLLKPQSDIGSQVVVQGRVVGAAKAREYQAMKPKLLGSVLESFAHLASEADLILVEGAGSASEVNLRLPTSPIWGLHARRAYRSCWWAISTVGGVIASLVGTKAVIDRPTMR
jgi:adenosylcobyric acid synthase